MAITPTTGATASLAVAGTTLAFAANTLTNGQTVVVCISIPGTTTVSGIADGGNTYTKQSAITNGSSIRSEIWTAPVTLTTGSRTITITFSGSTLASAAYEEYAGSTGIGNIGTPTTGTSVNPGSPVATQDDGSFSVTCCSAATVSGTTAIDWVGTRRQSVIPALTTASTWLVDSTSPYALTSTDGVDVSVSVTWASVAIELRTGVSPSTIVASKAVGPNIRSAQNYQVVKPPPPTQGVQPSPIAQVLLGGTTGLSYSETISGIGGTAPYTFTVTVGALPTGTSLNSTTGVISGTTSAAGTFNFTVKATDNLGLTGIYGFQIMVSNPVASGGSFVSIG